VPALSTIVQKGNIVEPTYSHYIYFREAPGEFQSITVSGCASREEAIKKAEDMARTSKWHNPRWYEFWRWGDRKVFITESKE
jgi:hypothetical protein